tara:strand:+ start:517 stop:744 length:228 start_codon:yes stop_codon:yes gene_type:complete
MSIVDNMTEAHELELFERGVLDGIQKAYREISGLLAIGANSGSALTKLKMLMEFHEQVVKDVSGDDGYDEDGDAE